MSEFKYKSSNIQKRTPPYMIYYQEPGCGTCSSAAEKASCQGEGGGAAGGREAGGGAGAA
jgi:hypothetical protein